MKYFPIFLDADQINALVVGGGDVAARKIELLLKTTSKITVMSELLAPSVERLIKTENLTWLQHNYQTGLMNKINLVIAATDNEAVNAQVHQEATLNKILVNVVDQPELCSYITPAIIDRSPMIVAICSSGSAPILVRMLREQIEKWLPAGYGKLADFSLKFRDHVKARIKGLRNRRTFWEQTLRGEIGQEILSGKTTSAEQKLIASLKHSVAAPTGDIVFIHTLNGQPDNLTLAAHRALQFADAVFYDDEVNFDFIEYVRRDADKYPQDIPASVLVNFQHAIELAQNGQKVIYFLAGDIVLPENESLAQSGINHTVLYNGY